MVESQPSKLLVAGSIPVSRSSLRSLRELRLASPAFGELRLAVAALGGLRLSSQAKALRSLRSGGRHQLVRLAVGAADLSAVARSAKADVAQ